MASTVKILIARAAVPSHRTPESERQDWSAADARRQALTWAGITGQVGASTPAQRRKLARAFAFVASPGLAISDYKLPHHYVESSRLKLNRRGMVAAGNALQGARGGVQIPASDIRGVRTHLGEHYRALSLDPPWASNRRAESREVTSRQADFAGVDAPKRKLYYILQRADEPDDRGFVASADEVERAADRFMVEALWSGRVIGLNHLCADCPHDFNDHHNSAGECACRAAGCICVTWNAFTPEPFKLVENFIFGGTVEEGRRWHGQELAEPFKPGDHILGVRVEHDSLFEALSQGSSISWEASFEVAV